MHHHKKQEYWEKKTQGTELMWTFLCLLVCFIRKGQATRLITASKVMTTTVMLLPHNTFSDNSFFFRYGKTLFRSLSWPVAHLGWAEQQQQSQISTENEKRKKKKRLFRQDPLSQRWLWHVVDAQVFESGSGFSCQALCVLDQTATNKPHSYFYLSSLDAISVIYCSATYEDFGSLQNDCKELP